MSDYSETRFFMVVVASFLLVLVLGILIGTSIGKERAAECAARGGVEVRTAEGFKCIKAEELK